MNSFCLVTTTCTDAESAQNITAELLRQKLAACVQVDSINSSYMWEGKLAQNAEWRLHIKTATRLFAEVSNTITTNHPYKVPEIIATPITALSNEYAKWLQDSLKSST